GGDRWRQLVAEDLVRDAADDAQHHRHHRALLAHRHLCQLRHREDPHERRPDRPDARLRHLGVPARNRRRRPAARRLRLALHVPDPRRRRILHPARHQPARHRSVSAVLSLPRMRFWGSATLATGVFLTYLIPETLLFIPLFKIFAFVQDWTGIELMNHWWVLIVVFPTLTVPFCTWIMIGYFASIPKELDEAALIDGAGYLQVLTRIFLPV